MSQNILIAGLGLIGGSIAKNLTESGQNYTIGYDVKKKTLEFASSNGIVNETSTDFKEAVQKADIILLAAPISETIRLMESLDTITFTKDVIVTDVASVKSPIINAAKRLTNKSITFIGGHPMAGSHKRGIEAAKSHLFENAIYVLIPPLQNDEGKVNLLKEVLQHTGSKFVVLRPDEHDEMTGVVSHFPHLIASSLVHQAKKWQNTHSFLPNLAAGGFRDITRIASSNPKMWQDIFYHNRDKLSYLLGEWINEMKDLKSLIDKNEKTKMITYLENAKNYRDGLPEKEKGAIPSFFDIYVDIRDQPGALASVVLLLANKKISINNIQILEIREGLTGALRLSFSTKEIQEASLEVLHNHGYEATIQD
ncbi:prephenate dehydrogenase [Oceanobacillus halophilus]|uniref:Prephenate dehydrogenase n=1 Tax=Oceanobacillus halophilus TaxID=930130 RepID=A0A495ACG4_9BACI|nr:prephenate dehydrogenase [Oceanobacillus halophilus]RKQ37656.1 prephenate dehydrogenase [Oceanobacillus halophilus]